MKILITHAYSRKNAGDAAILYAQAREILRLLPSANITIASMEDTTLHGDFYGFSQIPMLISSAYIKKRSKIANSYHLARSLLGGYLWAISYRSFGISFDFLMLKPEKIFLNELTKTDLIVPVGGGYIQSSGNGIFDLVDLILVLQPLYLATFIKKPVILYSQSIGPFKSGLQKRITAKLLRKCTQINVRENTSLKLLRSMDIPDNILQQTADASFLLTYDKSKELPLNLRGILSHSRRPIIGVTMRAWLKKEKQFIYEREVALALDVIIERHNASVLLIPQVTADERNDDDRIVESRVFELMKQKKYATNMDDQLDFGSIKNLYGNLDYLIGTRFHSVIFSLSEGIPSIAIEYVHKTSGIMSDLGLDRWVIKIEDVTAGNLVDLFEKLVTHRKEYTEQLNCVLPAYIEKARKANDLIVTFDNHRSAPYNAYITSSMAKKDARDILDYGFLGQSSFQAYALILFFFQGKITFREAFKPLVNGGFKTKNQRSKFRRLFFEYIEKKFGPFTLYGNSFSPASLNYIEAVTWIDEVIKKDQYQTNLIKPGNIVIDAGANIGVFSIKVAHDIPGSTVYSFEPTPRTFETLTRNTVSYPAISCFKLGLGDSMAEKKISIWDDSSGSNSIVSSAHPEFGESDRIENVGITTIDEIAKNLPRVDFIKMDTEGYEANILKGASETIKKWKPIIAMSAYHNIEDKEKLPKLLKSICPDYICELRHDHEEDLICRVAN